MNTEALLTSWTKPSSDTEQDKQNRTVRMIREAIAGHTAFRGCSLSVYAKGSYPNNTNVKTESDVDIAVQCSNVFYYDLSDPALPRPIPYSGVWTPSVLRTELERALRAKFGSQADSTGNVAIKVSSSTARVDADVVPCFDYRNYLSPNNWLEGSRIFRKDHTSTENFPDQHLKRGKEKNNRTFTKYKKTVRILKRTANSMLSDNYHRDVVSYFVESLVYNCPDAQFNLSSWTDITKSVLYHIWQHAQGDVESADYDLQWMEANNVKYLVPSSAGMDTQRRQGLCACRMELSRLGAMISQRQYLQALAAVVAAVYVVGLWLNGVKPELEWLRIYSIAVATLIATWSIWDRWLWRAPLICRRSSLPPSISGTWKGTLRSNWDAAGASGSGTERIVFLVVRQTFGSTRVRLLSTESESKSSLASVSREGGLSYIYMSEPRATAPPTSGIHRGGAILSLSGAPVQALRGRYWTDRDTKGALTFDQRVPKLADDYEMAEELFK